MAKKKVPVIAIVGRTNVGKSTLFNAIVGRRLAIVEDVQGVTRDRHYAVITRHGHPFVLVDTGGLIGEDDTEMQTLVREQSELAIDEADMIFCVFDGVYGVHPEDEAVVDILRRSTKPVMWLINKCEKPLVESQASEFYALGIDDIRCISAAHNVGVGDLIRHIQGLIEEEKIGATHREPSEDPGIKVAIIGRPNVGKSTFVNKLIGQDRLITSPMAGTTRDSIDLEIVRDGQKFILTDTAGLRKKARVDDGSVERFSNLRTLRSLARSDVAVLMLDASQGMPSEQEQRMASLAHERGRGLVIVVNKWDAVEKDHRSVKDYTDMVYASLKFVTYAPIVFVSALSGRRCPSVLQIAQRVYESRKARIPTSVLNKALKRAFEKKPPPSYHGEAVKFFFATQVDTEPPTIVLFVNHPRRINFSYERYIRNRLREDFPYEGVDIRIIWRKKGGKDTNEAANA